MTGNKTRTSDLSSFISDSNAVISELSKESDRGAALVGAHYLDRLVEELVRAKMIDDHKRINRLLEYPGTLTTAASKADLAFALGWIGTQVYSDLALARKIRNQFGHSDRSITFDDLQISQMCGQFGALKFARPYRLRKSRDQFLYTTLMLALQLTGLRQQAQRPGKGVDPSVRSVPGPRKTNLRQPN